jgi:hypothetical protein
MWLLAPALQGIYASPLAELRLGAVRQDLVAPRGKLTAPARGMGEMIGIGCTSNSARGVAFEFGCAVNATDLDPSVTIDLRVRPGGRTIAEPHAPAAAALARCAWCRFRAMFFEPNSEDCGRASCPRSSGVRARRSSTRRSLKAGANCGPRPGSTGV